MKKFLKKILFGITLPQEFLCVSLDGYAQTLKVFIKNGISDQKRDVTEHHLFVGYKPLIIAIDKKYINPKDLTSSKSIFLSFGPDLKNELATIEIRHINEIKLNSTSCLLFEGVKGTHSFTNQLHKLFSSIRYHITADKKKNIYLDGNLYDQVKIAYSVPRAIYLVSVGTGNIFNIFPTDLSGRIGDDNFIISLRSGGKANEQIEKQGKCLIAIMEADSFQEVYKAGRNHMKDLSNADTIGIQLRNDWSSQYDLPIPLRAIQYYELEKIEKFEFGIHTIHFFKITNTVMLSDIKTQLAHIHRDYAEWRKRNGIATNYLLRNK